MYVYIYIYIHVFFFFFYCSSHSHSLSSGHDQNAEASRIPGLRGGEGGKDQKLFVVEDGEPDPGSFTLRIC